jgi:hypothetical protein
MAIQAIKVQPMLKCRTASPFTENLCAGGATATAGEPPEAGDASAGATGGLDCPLEVA